MEAAGGAFRRLAGVQVGAAGEGQMVSRGSGESRREGTVAGQKGHGEVTFLQSPPPLICKSIELCAAAKLCPQKFLLSNAPKAPAKLRLQSSHYSPPPAFAQMPSPLLVTAAERSGEEQPRRGKISAKLGEWPRFSCDIRSLCPPPLTGGNFAPDKDLIAMCV